MKIQKHSSLIMADKVLMQVRRNVESFEYDRTLTVTVWANCREQGYHILAGHRAVGFARDRHSDKIVVITNNFEEFDVTTNMPSEHAFKSAVYCDSVAAAADHVTAAISDGIAHPAG